jgi:acetyltransferase-like isoleucine patch superfamily enzyme
MLDYGAEHIKLRQLDMPRNFLSGNNCVAEAGQFPSNFLLGVSTLGNDIRYRRQMRSRPGEPITVAGNPPVEFASAHFESENEAQKLPGFPLFLTRVFLNDIFSIGILRIPNIIVFVLLYTGLLRLGENVVISAFIALVLSEAVLVLSCALIKKILVGSQWGAAHSTPFWSWRHLSYFFAQDCFFAWCKQSLRLSAGTMLSNIILRLMGCRVGKRTIVASPLQASDWNAVSFGNDCIVNGFLQYHTFESMILRVKRTEIGDGGAINFGATVMGGAVIEPETTLLPLGMVLKEMHLPTATYEGSPVEPVRGNRYD